MNAVRRHLMRHRLSAAWLIALALLMKMLVPTGYMIGTATGSLTIELCPSYAPVKVAASMPGMAHHQDAEHHPKEQHQGKEMPPCAFSGLSAPSLAGADPLLLATAIAFVILTVSRLPAHSTLPDKPDFLRPPLRGPPARI